MNQRIHYSQISWGYKFPEYLRFFNLAPYENSNYSNNLVRFQNLLRREMAYSRMFVAGEELKDPAFIYGATIINAENRHHYYFDKNGYLISPEVWAKNVLDGHNNLTEMHKVGSTIEREVLEHLQRIMDSQQELTMEPPTTPSKATLTFELDGFGNDIDAKVLLNVWRILNRQCESATPEFYEEILKDIHYILEMLDLQMPYRVDEKSVDGIRAALDGMVRD